MKEEKNKYFAAIDLGSNSFHLIIVQKSNAGIIEIDKLKYMVRLGEGLDKDKRLGGVAIVRALDALIEMQQRLSGIPPEQIRAVGTNTMRIATNADEFLRAAQAALGHEIEIIGGMEEARLIYRGITSTGSCEGKNLVIDIGGGSTELIIGDDEQPLFLRSLEVGCANMANRFFANGKISKSSIKDALNFVGQVIEPYIKTIKSSNYQQVITSSGTAKSTEKVLQKFNLVEAGINQQSLFILLDMLADIGSYEKLSERLGIDEARSFGFCGGVCILSSIFKQLNINNAIVSSSALREGVLFELMQKDSGIAQDQRMITIHSMQQRFNIDIGQANRVKEIAQHFVKCFKKIPDKFVCLLIFAADLHEIGLAISGNKQNNHGAYIIENADMPGFSQQMQKIMAILIKGQRKKIPAKLIRELDEKEQIYIWHILLILRLSILLYRSREDVFASDKLPNLKVNKNTIELKFAKDYLSLHPLTLADLNEEQVFWEDASMFKLKFSI